MTTAGSPRLDLGPQGYAGPVAAVSSDGANMRFARHAQLLARWSVLPEPWALAVEEKRLAAIDRTPGPATFGR